MEREREELLSFERPLGETTRSDDLVHSDVRRKSVRGERRKRTRRKKRTNSNGTRTCDLGSRTTL